MKTHQVLKMHNLRAGHCSFQAYSPPAQYYSSVSTLSSANSTCYSEEIPFSGFLVVRNVFPSSTVNLLRDLYFSMFNDEYSFTNGQWNHVIDSCLSHGVGNHPARNFVRSTQFIEFINSPRLRFAASRLLDASNVYLCPRAIVRSFSHYSKRFTHAHRDCDYFVSSKPSKAITAWVPLGPADLDHGQLIYLKDSHLLHEDVNKLVKKDRTISSDLGALADSLQTSWYLPDVTVGDVVFHCMNNIHASFSTSNKVPRLSCDLRFAASLEYSDPRWNSTWAGDDGL